MRRTVNDVPGLDDGPPLEPPGDPDARPLKRRNAAEEPLQWIKASEHKPRPIRWLWPKFIPRGELTLFEGKKKAGKSSALGAIVGAVTQGLAMPDGVGRSEPAGVVWITGEESIDAVTLRLADAGADMDRVVLLSPDSRQPKASDAEGELRAAIEANQAALVVIDPIKSFLRGDDSDEIGVRAQLLGFARTAQATGAAIVCTRHWTKGARAADERGGGSISYGAIARATLAVAQDEKGTLALFVVESSNVRAGHAMTFRLEGDEDSGRPPQARWLERTMVDPDDFGLADPAAAKRAEQSKRSMAVGALRRLLSTGPVPVAHAKAKVAGDVECSPRTVEEAAREIGVTTVRPAFGKPALWRLDSLAADTPMGGETVCETGRSGASAPSDAVQPVSQRIVPCETVKTASEPQFRTSLAVSQTPSVQGGASPVPGLPSDVVGTTIFGGVRQAVSADGDLRRLPVGVWSRIREAELPSLPAPDAQTLRKMLRSGSRDAALGMLQAKLPGLTPEGADRLAARLARGP